jgi:hypothetical protein
MKKERQARIERFTDPDPEPDEILNFHTEHGFALRSGRTEHFAAGIEGGVNVGSQDLLRLWIALSGFQPQDLELLLQRYGFSENGPQSLGQIARARGCDPKTVRLKLRRIEGEIKRQLLRR